MTKFKKSEEEKAKAAHEKAANIAMTLKQGEQSIEQDALAQRGPVYDAIATIEDFLGIAKEKALEWDVSEEVEIDAVVDTPEEEEEPEEEKEAKAEEVDDKKKELLSLYEQLKGLLGKE